MKAVITYSLGGLLAGISIVVAAQDGFEQCLEKRLREGYTVGKANEKCATTARGAKDSTKDKEKAKKTKKKKQSDAGDSKGNQ